MTYFGPRLWGVVGDDPVELEWHHSPQPRFLDLWLPHQAPNLICRWCGRAPAGVFCYGVLWRPRGQVVAPLGQWAVFEVFPPLRAHLDQVPLYYPNETVVQPSSTAHLHCGFPTVEPLSWYSNKLLSSNLKTAIFQPSKRCHRPLKRMFLKTFLPHWCKTLETFFSWIVFHGGGGVGASGSGCIGETARLHHQRFVRRGDIHPCALFGFPFRTLDPF